MSGQTCQKNIGQVTNYKNGTKRTSYEDGRENSYKEIILKVYMDLTSDYPNT